MGLGDILFAPITAPVSGFIGILEALRDQALAEMPTLESMQRELIQLNASLEAGELSEEEFEKREAELLERIKALRAEQEEMARAEQEEDAEEDQ